MRHQRRAQLLRFLAIRARRATVSVPAQTGIDHDARADRCYKNEFPSWNWPKHRLEDKPPRSSVLGWLGPQQLVICFQRTLLPLESLCLCLSVYFLRSLR